MNSLYLLSILFHVALSEHLRYARHSWRLVNDGRIELTQDLGGEGGVFHDLYWDYNRQKARYLQKNNQTLDALKVYLSTDLLTLEEWTLTRVIAQYQYDTTGGQTEFLANHHQCCREGSQNVDIYMKINLINGNRGSPQSIPIAPIMEFEVGKQHSFPLSPTDPDGQTVKCRRSNFADSGIRGIGSATFYDISEDCTLTVDLPADGVGIYYELQIVMYTDDGDEMPLDFSLKGIAANSNPPTCTILNAIPANGFEVDIGGSISITWDVNSNQNRDLDINVVSVSQFGNAKINGEVYTGFKRRYGKVSPSGTITYELNIPDYNGVDRNSLDGYQVGAAIQIKDNDDHVALCNVGITIRDQTVGTDNDMDGDGILDDVDNCPLTSNTDQIDTDGDGIGDVCDNCVNTPNTDQADVDQDGVGDICDNCVSIANMDQAEQDGDSFGDACDNCPSVWNPDQRDSDDDGIGDWCSEPEVCTGEQDAFQVLITNVEDQGQNRKCYTYSIERLFPGDSNCVFPSNQLLLGTCDGDGNLRDYGVNLNVINNNQWQSATINNNGVKLEFGINIGAPATSSFTLCMKDIFEDITESSEVNTKYSNMVRFFRNSPNSATMTVTEVYNVGLPCLSINNNAVGNGETVDFNEMTHEDGDLDKSSKWTWVTYLLIGMGSASLTFGIVMLCICYGKRQKKVKNQEQINNAMKATIEHEMEVKVETTEQKIETESNPDYEGGMENVIR